MAGLMTLFSRFWYAMNTASAITASTGPWVSASSTKKPPPRNPPICGMRLVSVVHSPATGASGTPSSRPVHRITNPASAATNSEPGEVAAERRVDDAAQPVGPVAARQRHEGAEPPHHEPAVDHHAEGVISTTTALSTPPIRRSPRSASVASSMSAGASSIHSSTRPAASASSRRGPTIGHV